MSPLGAGAGPRTTSADGGPIGAGARVPIPVYPYFLSCLLQAVCSSGAGDAVAHRAAIPCGRTLYTRTRSQGMVFTPNPPSTLTLKPLA